MRLICHYYNSLFPNRTDSLQRQVTDLQKNMETLEAEKTDAVLSEESALNKLGFLEEENGIK